VYQNYGFTPAWRECIAMVVSGGGLPWHAVCVDGANVIDRHSVDWRLRSSHHSRPHPATAPRTPLTTIVIHSRQVWNHHSDTQSRICGRWWARVRCVRAATMEQRSTRQECCTRRQSQARLRRRRRRRRRRTCQLSVAVVEPELDIAADRLHANCPINTNSEQAGSVSSTIAAL